MPFSDPGGAPGWVESIVLGVVEGLTEFLPISSTGHLIVANRMLGGADPTYEIAVQIGAISAILFLYRGRLLDAARTLRRTGPRGSNLLVAIAVAALPAAVLGLWLGSAIEETLFSPTTVGISLVAGGIVLLGLERWLARRGAAGNGAERGLESLRLRDAWWIGVWQCLALVPGTSRAAATIAGALVLGYARTAAAEFSFLVGLPVLYGAGLLAVVGEWDRVSGPLLGSLLLGGGVAFVTALAIVGPFVRFLQRHTFVPFGWYRIAAGTGILAAVAAGGLDG